MKWIENWFRLIIRDELDLYFGQKPRTLDSYQVTNSETGAEIIMPNYIKEAFDQKKVTTVSDILSG